MLADIINTCILVYIYTPRFQHYDLQAQYSTLTWLLSTHHMQHLSRTRRSQAQQYHVQHLPQAQQWAW